MKFMKWMIVPVLLTLLVAGCVDKVEEQPNESDQLNATPSLSPTETLAPTVTPSLTPTLTASPTPTATPSLTPTPPPTPEQEPQTYRVYVDSDYGFGTVRHVADRPRTDLDPRNLEIHIGDTVIWRNDDDSYNYGYRLDIVSREGLWDPVDGVLMHYGKELHHTFNEPGVYTVAIKKHPKTQNQTITVTE
ncbi:hypothetical protein B6U67_03495 [Methanosarcinales archaeon ex4484_138]|nr:MAG: hypothetical protein B6U67_03495 [Methanosarcinales archaeon ex4484_138]